MKKVVVMALVIAAGLFLGVMGYAATNGGYGPRAGVQADPAALQNFQKETAPLRDQIISRRTEIRNEYAKDKPDLNRIASLEKEIVDLRMKIQAAAQKQGLSTFGRGYGKGSGQCGMTGTGCGAGRMAVGGCDAANCPKR